MCQTLYTGIHKARIAQVSQSRPVFSQLHRLRSHDIRIDVSLSFIHVGIVATLAIAMAVAGTVASARQPTASIIAFVHVHRVWWRQ